MKRAIVMLGLLLSLSGAIVGAAQATDATLATTERLQALDGQILTRLNAIRASHGLRPLVLSDELENAAVAHSRALIQAGVFQHDSPDGTSFAQRLKHFYTPSGYSSWTAGENLLYSTADVDADTAIQAWLDSPPHRENMLEPDWREVGIGSIHASWAGGMFGGDPTWVITMDFGVRTGGTRVAARKTPAKATAVRAKERLKPATKKVGVAHAKKPAAKPKPKPMKLAKMNRVFPVPGASAPYEPPLPGSPDPAGDALDTAAFGHHADTDRGDGTGGEELAPLPPPPTPDS